MNELIFGYLAIAIVFLSIFTISRRNPVHSVLAMLVMFFHLAALYIFLNAEFIAAIQVIVYAGAILVLFLFVIFLMNLREEIRSKPFVNSWFLGLLLTFALAASIFTGIKAFVLGPQGKYTDALISSETHTVLVGKLMYTEYIYPFEIASLILLVAVVGAIVIAKRHHGE